MTVIIVVIFCFAVARNNTDQKLEPAYLYLENINKSMALESSMSSKFLSSISMRCFANLILKFLCV